MHSTVYAAATCDATANQALVRSGDATISGSNEIILTPDQSNKRGGAWSAQLISLANPFTLKFQVYLGAKNYDGADGLVFAFQRAPSGSNTVGQYGGALGVGGVTPAIAIEFDTFNNDLYSSSYNDMDNDHTMIYNPANYDPVGGGGASSLISSVVDLGNIEDGVWHIAEINWDPNTKQLNYKFDGIQRASINRDLITTDFKGNPYVYYGFTGGTGGFYNQQSACIITAPPPVINNAPIITSNGGGTSANLSITEKTTHITYVTATDVNNDALTYKIIGGADSNKFSIDATTGRLSFITPPNYSAPTDVGANNVYEVVVQVNDPKDGIDSQNLAITVTSAPTNSAPIITSNGGTETATLSVNENQKAVTTVTATDINNDTLTYSISGVDAAKFSIDATTGVLSFISAPDYEAPTDSDTNNSYILQVQVNDGHGGTDVQTITINVMNVNEPPILRVKALLQGPYSSSDLLMKDDLRVANLIPTQQPFTEAPFNYAGTEVLNSNLLSITGSAAIVDWVLVELRDAAEPKTIIAQYPRLLTREGNTLDPSTGSIDIVLTNLATGNYYIAVRHRNHLAVMTAQAVTLSPSPTLIDFTSPDTHTYGSDARNTIDTLATLWAGDINNDNLIIANGPKNDPSDLLGSVLIHPNNRYFNTNYVSSGYLKEDTNLDGSAIFAGPSNDLNILIGNVLIHPSNSTNSANYIIKGTLPK
jgi:hypothetical protein